MMAIEMDFSNLAPAAEAPRVALAVRCGPEARNR